MAWWRRAALVSGVALSLGVGVVYRPYLRAEALVEPKIEGIGQPDRQVEMVNWSGNHSVQANLFYTPSSEGEVQSIMAHHQAYRIPIRPSGTGLSPNGLSFEPSAMITLSQMTQLAHVDVEKKLVRVQPGISIENLSKQLAPHGLTLQNFASIREQQLVGFTQAGAHGTGVRIPPVDEQVESFTLISPAKGRLEVSREGTPELFKLMNVGLGCFGVITEMTIKCVEDHYLREETLVKTWDQIKADHRKDLLAFRHLRYLWIPYTRETIVVKSNPVGKGCQERSTVNHPQSNAMRTLLKEHSPSLDDVDTLGIAQMRDHLLSINCTDPKWIRQVNRAELEAWRQFDGTVEIDRSDQILGFDCGGQQLVFEVCFNIGDPAAEGHPMPEIQFIEELMELIESSDIPAPSPIEQRFSARSSSLMSPAYSDDESDAFCWVGIIIYLPDELQRKDALAIFDAYRNLLMDHLGDRYELKVHWAKVELPKDTLRASSWRQRIQRKFPLTQFHTLRKEHDPDHLLINELLTSLL